MDAARQSGGKLSQVVRSKENHRSSILS